jgi:hypothetical protein
MPWLKGPINHAPSVNLKHAINNYLLLLSSHIQAGLSWKCKDDDDDDEKSHIQPLSFSSMLQS